MKVIKLFLSGLTVVAACMATSCSQEPFNPGADKPTAGMGIVHAPDIYAWSGNQTLGLGRSRAGYESTGRETPDFAEWCAVQAPVIPACPAVPDDVITVTPLNYSSIKLQEGGKYLFSGDLQEYEKLNVTIFFSDLPKNSEIYIDGNWTFYDSRSHDGSLAPAEYPSIYVLKESMFSVGAWEEDTVTLSDINLYNYGCSEIYDWYETINKGFTIYNTGSLNIENNSEETKDIVTEQPIYSTGTVRFGGDAYINADNYYFREVCVDGKLTVEGTTAIKAGYINADETVCEGSSKIELAPEGLLVSGTIAMRDNAVICSTGNEADRDLGAILTNEILGENKEYVTDHDKSEVNLSNFSTFFRNIDIFVTKTVNNYQKAEVIEEYQPAGGRTTALLEVEFDASGDDYFGYNDVNGISCGGGYKYLPKAGEIPEQPEQPEQPETPDQPDQPVVPGDEAESHDNEVEVNLSINDSHTEGGELKYRTADLWTKLSIHVRKGTDVEVVMPVPATFFCESDDFNILQKHQEGYFVGNESDRHTATYNIVNEDNPSQTWTVTLTVTLNLGQDYIKVTTDGITQNLIDYLMAKNGDGINFEVWNYFQTEYTDENGNVIAREGVDRETLQGYLNRSTVEFLDEEPDYYINAFGSIGANVRTPGDCIVNILPAQAPDYNAPFETEHLNDSPYNWIYVRNGVTPDHYHDGTLPAPPTQRPEPPVY